MDKVNPTDSMEEVCDDILEINIIVKKKELSQQLD